MRIFVAYGYNQRDQWIKDLVFPLIHAFGADVLTGEDLQGKPIVDGVQRRIQDSTALLGFTTRRDPGPNGTFTTHRWVTDELSVAFAEGKLLAEVREIGVDSQLGIGGGRQHIVYDPVQRDQCLLEIAKTIGGWMRETRVRLQIIPDSLVESLRPHLRAPGLQCTYRYLTSESQESPEAKARILPIKGGLFVDVKGVPSDGLVQLRVLADGKAWSSNYESIDSVGIPLSEER